MTNPNPFRLDAIASRKPFEPWELSLEVILVVSGFLGFVTLFAVVADKLPGIMS